MVCGQQSTCVCHYNDIKKIYRCCVQCNLDNYLLGRPRLLQKFIVLCMVKRKWRVAQFFSSLLLSSEIAKLIQ